MNFENIKIFFTRASYRLSGIRNFVLDAMNLLQYAKRCLIVKDSPHASHCYGFAFLIRCLQRLIPLK